MSSKTPLRAGTVKHDIAVLLRQEAPRAMSPKEIATKTGHARGTVRKALTRLVEDHPERVVKESRGLYRAFLDEELLEAVEDPPPKLHGLQLKVPVPQDKGSPPADAATAEANKQRMWDRVWKGRRVVYQHRDGSDHVLVSMSATDEPLDLFEFTDFVDYLAAALDMIGWPLQKAEAEIVSLEINQDYKSFEMQPRRLKLKGLVNAWSQAYQKAPDTVRVETRIHPEVTLEELLARLGFLQGLTGEGSRSGGPADGGGMYR